MCIHSENKINCKIIFVWSLSHTKISHPLNTSYYLYLQCVCVYTATVTADDKPQAFRPTHTHALMQRYTVHADTQSTLRHIHITCTQTPSATTYMFPLLSSLILEFITEKVHPCFLLFKPDVSSSSLPLFSFSLIGRPLLSIVLWSGEFILFLRAVCVCVCMCPQTKPKFSLFLCSSRHTNAAIFCLAGLCCAEHLHPAESVYL